MVMPGADPVMMVMPGPGLGEAWHDSGESRGQDGRVDDLLHVRVPLVLGESAKINGQL